MRQDRRVALVCSRFAPDVADGADSVLAELGRGLHTRGWHVDVLTSTARDQRTWRNELPEGESELAGLRVLRFRAAYERATSATRDRIGDRILTGAEVSPDDQVRWLNAGARVPGMHRYLLDNAGAYRAIVCAPYSSWTTLVAAEVAPDRTVLLPCLRDEPVARLEIYRAMLTGSRGLWFQTQPELDLADRIVPLPRRVTIVGSGVHAPARRDPAGFRARYELRGDFVLFAGRRDWAGGWPDLLRHMELVNAVLPAPIPLVTCGGGPLGTVPSNTRVIDLGHLDEDERLNAMAAAAVCVQPSATESFSRTVMEAWLAGTVVVANAASAVVAWHCARSGAGLVYADGYELAESLRLLLDDRSLAAEMARRGREHVLANHRWDDVLDRVERSLEEWT
jgi:glycosyltransferase involved in cell wall biosynthesis